MNNDLRTVVTGKVRLSYVHLFTPNAGQNGGDPKYSTTLLIPKSDIGTKQRIDAAINAAIEYGISKKFNGVRPPVINIPIHDGDGARPSDGMPFGEECKGHWVLTASNKDKQEVVDANLNNIINQSDIYSGIYARVSINLFPYANSGKKGIGCSLGPVQKLEDGEPLGGHITAASAFGDAPLPVGYNQQPVSQPIYPQQPRYQPAYAPQDYQQAPQQQVQTPVQPTPQPQRIDPITGMPVNGGVMGI